MKFDLLPQTYLCSNFNVIRKIKSLRKDVNYIFTFSNISGEYLENQIPLDINEIRFALYSINKLYKK